MPDFASIKSAVVTKLQALTVGAETVFNTDGVYSYEPEVDESIPDPFATITASENESDFATTADNRRVYGFVIRIWVERKERTPEQAEADLTEIVDATIDAFDKDITLSDEVLMIEAAPSAWQYSIGNKEFRVAEIRIRALVWFDTTT